MPIMQLAIPQLAESAPALSVPAHQTSSPICNLQSQAMQAEPCLCVLSELWQTCSKIINKNSLHS